MVKVMRPEELLANPEPQVSQEAHSTKNRSLNLCDGSTVRFRPPTMGDVRELKQAYGDDDMGFSYGMVSRLCTQYRDKPGLALDQFNEFSWEDGQKCIQLVTFFLGNAPEPGG